MKKNEKYLFYNIEVSKKLLIQYLNVIFINDGCRDKTPVIIEKICTSDKNIKLINFSRNFGHQIAINAGMDMAEGKAVVVIDADLQILLKLLP